MILAHYILKPFVWIAFHACLKLRIEHYYRMKAIQRVFRSVAHMDVALPARFDEAGLSRIEAFCASYGLFAPIHGDRDKWITRSAQRLE